MNNDQFVISIGDHKKAIFAKILSETNSMTTVATMANTHTNRSLVAEKDVTELKANRNCTTHTYKTKNHKYKTIHKSIVYNFMNTQDRLTFMDNLVKYLINRRFPNVKKPFQIFELMRTKGKDAWLVSTRKLKENPQATVSPRPKVYYTNKKKRNLAQENNQTSSESPNSSPSSMQCPSKQRIILQIPVPKTRLNVTNIKKKKILLESKQKKKSILLESKQKKKSIHIQKKALITQSRPITRSITRKSMQSNGSKNYVA